MKLSSMKLGLILFTLNVVKNIMSKRPRPAFGLILRHFLPRRDGPKSVSALPRMYGLSPYSVVIGGRYRMG